MHPCKPLATLFLSIFILLFSPSSFSGTSIDGCQLLLDAGWPSPTSVSLGVLNKLTIRDCSKGVCTLGFECGSGVCAENNGRPTDLISLAVIADRATLQRAINLMPGCKASRASQPTSIGKTAEFLKEGTGSSSSSGSSVDTSKFRLVADGDRFKLYCGDSFVTFMRKSSTGMWNATYVNWRDTYMEAAIAAAKDTYSCQKH